AAARHIEARDQRIVGEARCGALLRGPYPFLIDELPLAGAPRNAPDAHPYEVAILAVVIDPFLDQRLVGEPAVAGIDDALVPALALRAEYDSVELAAVARGIAPGEDHGLAI